METGNCDDSGWRNYACEEMKHENSDLTEANCLKPEWIPVPILKANLTRAQLVGVSSYGATLNEAEFTAVEFADANLHTERLVGGQR